jgi:alpha-D-ribose 1-methylphosphonate 5-triphosphate synthase subunit PhnH
MDTLALAGGFPEPVLGSQSAFRALMEALARPGTIQKLPPGVTPPAPLSPELATVALTLCDHDTPVWLAPALETAAVTAWLAFHAGAPLTRDPSTAMFAFATDPRLTLGAFAQGSDEYPDRSTTLVLAVDGFDAGPMLRLTGPGIETSTTIAPAGLPHDFLAHWAENRARFPRGIDLILVSGGAVVGLPRATRIGAV